MIQIAILKLKVRINNLSTKFLIKLSCSVRLLCDIAESLNEFNGERHLTDNTDIS